MTEGNRRWLRALVRAAAQKKNPRAVAQRRRVLRVACTRQEYVDPTAVLIMATDPQQSQEQHLNNTPPRPVALTVIPENIPIELRARPQWVVWKYEFVKGRWTKPPSDACTGRHADSTDQATWAPFEAALDAYERGGWDGIGYCPLPDEGISIIDLDHVCDRETGRLSDWSAAIVAQMQTYTEVSPSAGGLRLVCRGHKPDRSRSKKGQIEIYDGMTADGKAGGKYLTFTGHRLPDTPDAIQDRQEQLSGVYRRELLDGHAATEERTSAGARAKKWSPPDGPLSDEDIVHLALEGRDAKLSQLWNGDLSGNGGDHSSADAALCCKLLWWLGASDAGRVDRLFRQSGLMRAKWDERRGEKTYGQLTIEYALGLQTEFRQPRRAGQCGKQDAHTIILEWLKEYYQPAFRSADQFWSERAGRLMSRSETVNSPNQEIVERLMEASNAPRYKNGNLKYNALPGFFIQWAKPALGTLLDLLPDEEDAEASAAKAAALFREHVVRGLRMFVTIGESEYHGAEQVTHTERRPIACFAFKAVAGRRWQRIRDYSVWGRVGDHGQAEIALHARLFSEVRYLPLAGITQNAFGRLSKKYGVGITSEEERPGGKRAVVLADDVVSELDFTINWMESPSAAEQSEQAPS
jgi:hypothetical protein